MKNFSYCGEGSIMSQKNFVFGGYGRAYALLGPFGLIWARKFRRDMENGKDPNKLRRRSALSSGIWGAIKGGIVGGPLGAAIGGAWSAIKDRIVTKKLMKSKLYELD